LGDALADFSFAFRGDLKLLAERMDILGLDFVCDTDNLDLFIDFNNKF
jgi:hypothetical protein